LNPYTKAVTSEFQYVRKLNLFIDKTGFITETLKNPNHIIITRMSGMNKTSNLNMLYSFLAHKRMNGGFSPNYDLFRGTSVVDNKDIMLSCGYFQVLFLDMGFHIGTNYEQGISNNIMTLLVKTYKTKYSFLFDMGYRRIEYTYDQSKASIENSPSDISFLEYLEKEKSDKIFKENPKGHIIDMVHSLIEALYSINKTKVFIIIDEYDGTFNRVLSEYLQDNSVEANFTKLKYISNYLTNFYDCFYKDNKQKEYIHKIVMCGTHDILARTFASCSNYHYDSVMTENFYYLFWNNRAGTWSGITKLLGPR
jgi:hypothetical protein